MENNKLNFLKQYGVDTEAGINNTMDFETYNEVLLDFLNTFPGDLNKANAYRTSGDINNYVILVHALKSNCRTLGFMQMGEMFYQHEMAGKQNNVEFINSNFNNLITEANKVYSILMAYKNMG